VGNFHVFLGEKVRKTHSSLATVDLKVRNGNSSPATIDLKVRNGNSLIVLL